MHVITIIIININIIIIIITIISISQPCYYHYHVYVYHHYYSYNCINNSITITTISNNIIIANKNNITSINNSELYYSYYLAGVRRGVRRRGVGRLGNGSSRYDYA